MNNTDSPFDVSEQPQGQDMDEEGWVRGPHQDSGLSVNPSWLGGAVLIVLGVVFLLQNAGLDIPFLRNWWALFILLPATSSLSRAWQLYRGNGQRFTGQVRGSLVGGLAMMLVAATFLFGLSWSLIWPIFLILAGLGALIGGLSSH